MLGLTEFYSWWKPFTNKVIVLIGFLKLPLHQEAQNKYLIIYYILDSIFTSIIAFFSNEFHITVFFFPNWRYSIDSLLSEHDCRGPGDWLY